MSNDDQPLGPLSRRAKELLDDDDTEGDAAHNRGVELLEQAMAAGEWSAPALLARGYVERGRLQDARAMLEPQVLAGRTDLAIRLANVLANLGQSDDAERAYQIAIESGDVGNINDYAVFLLDLGRVEEAIPLLQRAIDGGDDLAPGNLALLYLEDLNDTATAMRIARQYLDDSRPKSYSALAEVYRRVGNFGQAEYIYRKAIELGAIKGHIRYADFLEFDRRNLREAEWYLLAGKAADEPGWGYALGSFLLRRGNDDEAAWVLEHAANWGDLGARQLLDDEFENVPDDGVNDD